tara:strand:- start:3502 stop:3726 length:225 start_codon:yes stop_codon:yes gene_type:complete
MTNKIDELKAYVKRCSVTTLAIMNKDCKEHYGSDSAERGVIAEELLNRYRKGVNKRFPDDIVIEKIMNDGRRFV